MPVDLIGTKLAPTAYVASLFVVDAIVLPIIVDMFFAKVPLYVRETLGFLSLFSIPALALFSVLSLFVRPQYLAWQKQGRGWLFFLTNLLVVEILGVATTYIYMTTA